MIYLEDPFKILGDLGVSWAPDSAEDVERIKRAKAGLSSESLWDIAKEKLPMATFNAALAAVGGGGTKNILNSAFNPVAGLDDLLIKGVKSARGLSKLPNQPLPRFKTQFKPRGYQDNNVTSFKTAEDMTFTHGSNSDKLTLDNIQLTDAYKAQARPRAGKKIQKAIDKGTSDPLNSPAGFYNAAVGKNAHKGFGHPKATNAKNNYDWTLPKGSKVLEIKGTSNISVGDLQKYADDGYDIVKGSDITGAIEYIPLNKKSISGFYKRDLSKNSWGKWNKEIASNSKLPEEYAQIERSTKANGTWMKNADGTPFAGPPEQCVQVNSANSKKLSHKVITQHIEEQVEQQKV